MTGHTSDALVGLTAPLMPIPEALTKVQPLAGLYAIYTGPAALKVLGLEAHPADRPVYVGKAERSLRGRDLLTHFATGKTGSSTVRRSLAALLRDHLALRAVPRNLARPDGSANFAIAPDGDERLTTWMLAEFSLAVWIKPSEVDVLREVEIAVLRTWNPPLNLTDVALPWPTLKAARAMMAEQSRMPGPWPTTRACTRVQPHGTTFSDQWQEG